MDTFTRTFILFIAGSLIFAVSLIFALRRFSKLNVKTRARFASLLGFTGIASPVYTMSDFITWIKAICYSLPVSCVLALLVWKNKEKLNKMSKGVVSLAIVCSIFFWRWLHTVSFELESTLGFAVCFTMLFMAFSLDEKYLKFESH
jgi:FtsH-binding integral membrane protein